MVTNLVPNSLDSGRVSVLYEWTYAILIANLTVQVYRLVVQLSTIIFDIFRLTYAINLFWPLTTDDLKPYYQYFTSQYELLFKLSENIILTATAIYGSSCLLNYSVVGLGFNFIIFFCHAACLLIGSAINHELRISVWSVEFAIWTLTLVLELLTSILSLVIIIHFKLLT